jgi:hypothetical protein
MHGTVQWFIARFWAQTCCGYTGTLCEALWLENFCELVLDLHLTPSSVTNLASVNISTHAPIGVVTVFGRREKMCISLATSLNTEGRSVECPVCLTVFRIINGLHWAWDITWNLKTWQPVYWYTYRYLGYVQVHYLATFDAPRSAQKAPSVDQPSPNHRSTIGSPRLLPLRLYKPYCSTLVSVILTILLPRRQNASR